MMSNASIGYRARQWAMVCLGVLVVGIAAESALAGDCPGNPGALGTSRTLVVDPREHPRIGIMQYAETLPLEDHEVVLTFDDGPLPRNSNQILDILASQCVKATFFTIGRMARESPEGVRKLRDAGHSIGTHSQNHPLSMDRMPIERARQEIDDGIAATAAALGDANAVAPFFRIPGLLRADGVEEYLASQGIQTWSADFLADDWRRVSAARVFELAMTRLEARGKGIMLLHDIHARTVAALPRILIALKARGYRIVHVVPATQERPKTPSEPQQWLLHPTPPTVAISLWPAVRSFPSANTEMLPVPAVSEAELDGLLLPLPGSFDRSNGLARGYPPLPQQAPWPQPSPRQATMGTATLTVPAQEIFQIPEKSSTAGKTPAPLSHRAQQMPVLPGEELDGVARLISLDAGASRRRIPGSIPVTQSGMQPGSVLAR